MKRRRIVWGAALLVAAGLAAAIVPRLVEVVEEVEDRPFSGEAAIHPFFALKELFESLDVPTRTVASLRRLPPSDHVLWIAVPRSSTAPERVLRWVEAGGHAVILPAYDGDENPLLDAFGLSLFYENSADDDDHLSRPEFATDRPEWPRLYVSEEVDVLRSEGAPDAAWRLTVAAGEGRVTAFSDGAFLHNDSLGQRDHALVAWDAIAHDGPPAGVWLVYRDPPPSVWTVLTARAAPLAISLGVLCLTGLLFLIRRFGPLLEPEPRGQRQLAEHVRAVGDYLWSVRCEDVLLTEERDALARRLARGTSPEGDQLLELALQAAPSAGISEGRVREALKTRETRDRSTFTRIVHTLETLRRSS